MLGSWLCQKRMGASSRPFDLTGKEVAIKWQWSADLGGRAVKDKGRRTGREATAALRAAAPEGQPPSSGAPSVVLFAWRCANPRLLVGVPFLKGRKPGALRPGGAGGGAAPAALQSPGAPHSSHALSGARRSETGPGCGVTRSSRVWASALHVPAFQTFPPAALLATLGGTEGGRGCPCSRPAGAQDPRARWRGPWFGGERAERGGGGGESTLLVSWPQGGGVRGRQEQPSPCSFGEHRAGPPLGRLRQVAWHVSREAGFRQGFRGLLAGLGPSASFWGTLSPLSQLLPLVARNPLTAELDVHQPGRCHGPPRPPQTAVAPRPRPHKRGARRQSCVPHTCLPLGGRATFLVASLLAGSRVRVACARSRWSAPGRLGSAPRVSVPGGDDAGAGTRPLRVRCLWCCSATPLFPCVPRSSPCELTPSLRRPRRVRSSPFRFCSWSVGLRRVLNFVVSILTSSAFCSCFEMLPRAVVLIF